MPGIFISYRRSDSAGQAGRLFDRLTAYFGEDRVFMDVDTLSPSDHFATRIEKAIAGADVMLVLIGPRWTAEAARLADPADFVRRELMAAMRVECRLVPVSIDGVPFPDPTTLPEDLRAVLGSEGANLRHAEFGRDADHLIEVLSRLVTPSPEATRRCVGNALLRAGWPFSWLGHLTRRVPLRLLLATGLAGLIAAWSGSIWVARWQAHLAGYEAGSQDVTAAALQSGRDATDRGFILRGRVKDGANRDIEDATVTLRNFQTGKIVEATTNQDGNFQVDLRQIEVGHDTLIDLVVAKTAYRRFTDRFRYAEGFDYRSVLQLDGAPGVQ
jgi:hypothetical protein